MGMGGYFWVTFQLLQKIKSIKLDPFKNKKKKSKAIFIHKTSVILFIDFSCYIVWELESKSIDLELENERRERKWSLKKRDGREEKNENERRERKW